MSPEDSNNPGLNTHPDLSSVPLPEPTSIKSPYAPISGTLGDIADNVTTNDSSTNLQSQSAPISTPGVASDNPESTASAATQSSTLANNQIKRKKIGLIIVIIVVAIAIIGLILFFVIAKPFDKSGSIGGTPSESGLFYNDKFFIVSSEEGGKKKYAIYNSDGEAITDFIYDNSNEIFIGGTTLMKKGGQYGLVDQGGKEVIEFGKYNKITAYGGLYGLNKDGKDVLVNNRGEVVTEYNVDDFNHYSDYTNGQKTAYTLLRKDNHYVVYSPYGAKVSEFNSVISPTISSPDIGEKNSRTIIVYSGGVIVLNDQGNEMRRYDKNITNKLFGIFASKSGNIIGLSTVGTKLMELFSNIVAPDDRRENALIIGAAYHEYNYRDCAGLYYDDAYTEGDEDGFVLCVKTSGTHVVASDGSLSPNSFNRFTAKKSLTSLIYDDDIYPITNNSYATMTTQDGDKTYSIFYNGKKVINLVNTEKNTSDINAFTKTVSRNTYGVYGMNDNYVIHHVKSEATRRYSDGSFSKEVKAEGDATGELIFMNKKGEKICTFDKKGYTATTSVPTRLSPDRKDIYQVHFTDSTGFVNDIALVRKLGKDNLFDENGYTRINNKCEVINEDTYYTGLEKMGNLAILTSKKANRYTTELINKDGKVIMSTSANGTTPRISRYTDNFATLGTSKIGFLGYGTVLKQFDHFCNFGSALSINAGYVELKTAGYSEICGDKEAVGGEHFYFLPNGKEFYKWSESAKNTGSK